MTDESAPKHPEPENANRPVPNERDRRFLDYLIDLVWEDFLRKHDPRRQPDSPKDPPRKRRRSRAAKTDSAGE